MRRFVRPYVEALLATAGSTEKAQACARSSPSSAT